MQPLALIAGIPLGRFRRVKQKPKRTGWSIQIIPSNDTKKPDLNGIWKRAMQCAGDSGADGVHMLLAHYRDDERPCFKQKAGHSYRVIWISSGMSRKYGTDTFDEEIKNLLDFEDVWRKVIRPTLNSPLLLPETAFSAQHSVTDMWRRSRNVSREKDDVQHVKDVAQRFRKHHSKRKHRWQDTEGLTFSRRTDHGGMHLPSCRRKKLTFNLPDGFHFDVRHDKGRPFFVNDERRGRHKFVKYTNIDPHGYLRGGS